MPAARDRRRRYNADRGGAEVSAWPVVSISEPTQQPAWNPRYLAYCDAHGRAPEEQMVHDRLQWPGACMCGFILWLRASAAPPS